MSDQLPFQCTAIKTQLDILNVQLETLHGELDEAALVDKLDIIEQIEAKEAAIIQAEEHLATCIASNGGPAFQQASPAIQPFSTSRGILFLKNPVLQTINMAGRRYPVVNHTLKPVTGKRVESIDLLRGLVMIIMALDHVRDYFHRDAFFFSPTDLSQTSGMLFFTRFITHYCAPVFVFLAGISAYLYGVNKSRKQLANFLFTRGVWLVFVELFIVSLGRTFNPSYTLVILQVIWAIGVSMITLSAMIFMKRQYILVIGIVLIAAHNLLDNVHVTGNGIAAFLWSVLHEPKNFVEGRFTVIVFYPLIPWVGIIAVGYCFGSLYNYDYDQGKRRKILLCTGIFALVLFSLLRIFNIYGDAAQWSAQKNNFFSLLSFLNVTKYPPSLLYTLITLGPAMIFLALAEKPLNAITKKIIIFGRVPFLFYIAHIYLIHLLALVAAAFTGYGWSSMILNDRVNNVPALKGYGFNLMIVYMIWILLILLLYPVCKWFSAYKKEHQADKWWLSYL